MKAPTGFASNDLTCKSNAHNLSQEQLRIDSRQEMKKEPTCVKEYRLVLIETNLKFGSFVHHQGYRKIRPKNSLCENANLDVLEQNHFRFDLMLKAVR